MIRQSPQAQLGNQPAPAARHYMRIGVAETIRGHVSCSFLALVLKAALEDRIVALGRAGSRPEIIADLDSLTETEIEHEGKNVVPSRWLGAFMVSGRGR